MGLCGFSQRVGSVDPNLDLFVIDPAQEISGSPQQLLPAGGIVGQSRASQKDGALEIENLRVKRRNGSTALAKED